MRWLAATSFFSFFLLLLYGFTVQSVVAHPAGFLQRQDESYEMRLLARQDTASTTTPTTSSSSSAAAAAAATTCSMTSRLARGQSASWTSASVLSCCTTWNVTACYSRWQSSVDTSEQCIIPNCNDLASMDDSLMHGFSPLESSNGLGTQKNTFLIATSPAIGSWSWRKEAACMATMVFTTLLAVLTLL